MTYRVERGTSGDRVLFALSGELNGDHAAALQALLATEAPARVLLDLSDVILVDAETVRVLGSVESDGVTLVNCPEFVRTWIALESATHQTTSTTSQEEKPCRTQPDRIRRKTRRRSSQS